MHKNKGKGILSVSVLIAAMVLLSACSDLSGVGSSLGSSSRRQVTPIPADLPPATQAFLRDYDTAVNALKTGYVNEKLVDKNWLTKAATNRDKIQQGVEAQQFLEILNNTLQAIDDDSVGLQFGDPVTSTYPGIGVLIDLPQANKDRLLVLYVFKGSPAAQAGLKAHDAIVKINGEAVNKDSIGTLLPQLRNNEQTAVDLVVRTPGEAERDVKIVPEPVIRNSAPMAEFIGTSNIAYIAPDPEKLADMKSGTADALRGLMDERPLDGLILDLRVIRGNEFPINEMLALFANGPIGTLKGRSSKTKLEITGKSIAGSQDVRMAILTGEQTAGQAEAFAGILQDLGRARIFGKPTAGKVAIISTLDLPNTRLKLQIPTGEYLGVKNASWYQKGVTPDELSDKSWEDFTAEKDPQVDQALKWLQGS